MKNVLQIHSTKKNPTLKGDELLTKKELLQALLISYLKNFSTFLMAEGKVNTTTLSSAMI
ncbi:hypothetical protein BXY64_3960 [Marinifilum flexuosum]|uniref:Uncharacterized protein n=1 Tax=Marinifilum flexuosum TaxID=1117708 RepID=A0A419WNL4_9BACT|nr:hypothetical protein BXY64_3960 [Marinifilum flexuosum]